MAEHFISKSDFELPPNQSILRTADISDLVDRGNFIAAMINCYAVSQGKRASLATALSWKALHVGFNYQETCKNYTDSGGRSVLINEEVGLFLEAFARVSGHSKVKFHDKLRVAVFDVFDRQMRELGMGKLYPEISQGRIQAMSRQDLFEYTKWVART